jgi:fructuronate reductase
MKEALAAGRPIERLCVPLAAWFNFVRRKANKNEVITDPMAEKLAKLGSQCNGDAHHDVALFLSLERFWPTELAGSDAVKSALVSAYERLAKVQSSADLRTALSGL